MKVAIISTFLGQKSSGAEMSSYYLTKILDKAPIDKVEVFAITAKKTKKIPFKCYSLRLDKIPNIIIMIGNSIVNQITYRRILKIFKREKPDIIHIQDFPLIYASIKAAKKLNIKTVMTIRDFRHQCNLAICSNEGEFKYHCSKQQYMYCLQKSFESKTKYSGIVSKIAFRTFYKQNLLFKKLVKEVDGIISVSDFVKFSLIKSGVKKSIIDTIYVPKPIWDVNVKYRVENNTLFAAGLIVEGKGFQTIIKSVKILKNDYPDIKLRIAGDGSYMKRIKSLIKSLNLERNVRLLGKINEEQMQKEYLKASIILQPSIVPESLSRIIYEAFSAKKVVVSSDSGGNSEIVIDNKTGLLVKNKKNEKEFAKNIKILLESTKLRDNMGKRGYRLINKIASAPVVFKNHLKKYKKTLEKIKKHKVN